MTKRKRLGDLYVRGAELKVGDGEAEVAVWIQKPNPVQHENMLRIANAARSKITMRFKDKDSEEYLAAVDEVSDLFPTRDALVTYLVSLEINDIQPKIESELSLDEEMEWATDNYLQGLRDSWDDEMGDRYIKAQSDPEAPDEEAEAVFNELKRFSDEVARIMDGHRKALTRDYEQMSDAKIEDLVVEKHLKHKGTQAWFAAFRRAQVYYSVREPEKHNEYYFENLEEVESLALPVMRSLFEKIEEISVDPMEGKG